MGCSMKACSDMIYEQERPARERAAAAERERQRIAEEARIVEEARIAEEERIAEEARIAECARIQAESDERIANLVAEKVIEKLLDRGMIADMDEWEE
jgi:hypothetical protein